QSADPREDAALAMAEMQNGGAAIQDFPGLVPSRFLSPSVTSSQITLYKSSLPYSQQVQANNNINLDSMGTMNVDPTQYMAPMDLYESIWGGKSLSLSRTLPAEAWSRTDSALPFQN